MLLLAKLYAWVVLFVIAVVVAALIFVLLTGGVEALVARIRLLRYRWAHAGTVLFVCTTRHHWHGFLLNNVIPVLPPHVRVVWLTGRDRSRPTWHTWQALARSKIRHSKPFLAAVRLRGILTVPTHDLLLPLKHNSRVDVSVQEQVRPILLGALNQLERGSGGA